MATKNAQGTPAWLGAINDRTALSLLLENGVLTRNQIGALSGLSKPTAAQIVSRLEEAGLIYVASQISGGRGPNAAAYAAHTDRALGVAVDVTATAIHSTVADVSGAAHPVVSRPLAHPGGEATAATDIRIAIHEACRAADRNPATVRKVAIAVQGSVDPRTDELSFVDALPGWPRQGLRAYLESELDVTVSIDNDANLAAIAERTSGAGAELAGFALLWMGNGLGVSIDHNGSLLRGAAGGAGEIGYLPIASTAAHTIDPTAHDLQDLMGGPAVSRILRTAGVPGVTLEDRLEALITAAPAVRATVLAELAPRIANGVLPVLAVLDPGTIILGGPTGAAGGSQLAQLVQTQIRRTSRWAPDVITTAVGPHPVLRGAHDALVADVRASLLDDITSPSA